MARRDAPIRLERRAPLLRRGRAAQADPVRRRSVEIARRRDRDRHRAVGLGQDDAAHADRRAALGAGGQRCACSAQELRGAPAATLETVRRADRLHLPGAQPARRADRARRTSRWRSLLLDRASAARGARARAARCSTPSASASASTTTRASSRAASASASRSRARSRPQPRIVLADEPTASLDKQSGREVVDLMHDLAREQGVTVLLVTHDNRILDVADRIVHLEDGRLSTRSPSAVIANTQQHDGHARRRQPQGRAANAASRTLAAERVRRAARRRRRGAPRTSCASRSWPATTRSRACSTRCSSRSRCRFGELLQAERASLFLVDAARRELWLRVAQEEGGRPVEVRMPDRSRHRGARGSLGESLRIDDAYAHPCFNPEVDRATGFRTRSILCVPIADRSGRGLRGGAAAQQAQRGGLERAGRIAVRRVCAWSGADSRGVGADGGDGGAATRGVCGDVRGARSKTPRARGRVGAAGRRWAGRGRLRLMARCGPGAH